MPAAQEFSRLFAYDHWANQEALKAIEGATAPSGRSLPFLAHILSAQRLWWERIVGEATTYPVWPEFTVKQCAMEMAFLKPRWREIYEVGEVRLSTAVTYKNSKGEPWTSRVDEILMHVIMHGAYHRGQIALEMRASGNVPSYTDYIHAVRNRWLE
jgi:uncharacterized damage-inducible protein DinB